MARIIVLSGPIASGKTSFGEALASRHLVHRVSTRAYILKHTNTANERAALQAAGTLLDNQTEGAWVVDAVVEQTIGVLPDRIILVDSARIAKQVQKLKERFGAESVLHIHLTAPDFELAKRYAGRSTEVREFATYDEVKKSPTEASIEDLRLIADEVVDTSRMEPRSQVTFATEGRIGAPKITTPSVDVYVGGQWGSEGKGNICAFVAHEYDVLVRVGGPNAGHKVASPPYKYVQLPSGTGSNWTAKILLAAGSTIWLPTLLKEIKDHPWLRVDRNLIVDEQAMIIDEEDRAVESARLGSISSTLQGVGAAAARKIMGRGGRPPFGSAVRLARDEPALAPFIGNVRTELEKAYVSGKRIMLEGTQGTDLSIHHGSYPHVTSRETSAAGCLSDAGIAPSRVRKVVMVTRTYPIRVGGESGPIGVETSFSEISSRSGVPLEEIARTEIGTVSGRTRRIAEFDWEQLRRSADLNGATDVAISFADYLGRENQSAKDFGSLLSETQTFVHNVERVSGRPVSLISKRFAKDGVIDRRNW